MIDEERRSDERRQNGYELVRGPFLRAKDRQCGLERRDCRVQVIGLVDQAASGVSEKRRAPFFVSTLKEMKTGDDGVERAITAGQPERLADLEVQFLAPLVAQTLQETFTQRLVCEAVRASGADQYA